MGAAKQTTVGITGMTCAACSSRVERVLNNIEGVEAQVNLTTEKASISFDPEATNGHEITSQIEKIGFGVQTKKIEFDVLGMTCANCARRIEQELNKQEGVKKAAVNL